jgi:hypothetical protein
MSMQRAAPPMFRSLRLDVFRAVALPIWAVLAVLLAVAIAIKLRLDLPWYYVMGDPATTTRSPPFLGFISNVGAVLWAATATVFLFRYRMERTEARSPGWARFLLASGLFAAMLGVDDLFLVHDQLVPDVFGVAQGWVVALYALAACLYLLVFAPRIAATAFPLLLCAFALLGTSVALDQLMDRLIYLPASGFLEDAAKLMGIGTWLAYALHTCARLPDASPGSQRAWQPAAGNCPIR